MKRFSLPVALLAVAVSIYPLLAKKKKPEDITQTLELPKDLPATVTAETSRLVFHVSPLSGKGLLSAQVRDALKALLKSSGGATIVKLRAFVAGSGDLRRVPAIVSETFTDKHLPLPVVSVIQVGALPLEGAQVVIESTAVAKKEMNPLGLVFVSGQAGSSDAPMLKVAPLAEKTVADLKTALRGAGSDSADVLRVTCLCSSLEDHAAVRDVVEPTFRHAALDLVQLQRSPIHGVVECEAVAKLTRKIAAPVQFENPPGLPASPNFSQIALVSAPKLVLTGTQVSYGYQDSDARRAFERLSKALDQGGSSAKDVVMAHLYPLSSSIAEQVRRVRFDFFDKSRPPAATMQPFEGLPAVDAGFAVDVVAIAK
jgi:enamine deaminase RidA (YjgF/YER057c/UK114 family)